MKRELIQLLLPGSFQTSFGIDGMCGCVLSEVSIRMPRVLWRELQQQMTQIPYEYIFLVPIL